MNTRRAVFCLLALLGFALATASVLGSTTAARKGGSATDRGLLEPAACSGPNTGIGGWVGLYYADTLCVSIPEIPSVSVVATLAGASSCGIIGAEFQIYYSAGHAVAFYPAPGVTVAGDCLDDGCRLTFPCTPSGSGQRITLGHVADDEVGYGFAPASVRAPVAPLNPAMPFANFTRCDGQIVVMQHADSTTTSPVSLWCPNASDDPVLSYVTTQIARHDVNVSMDIVAANPMNPMTLLARLRKSGYPDIHMTAIDMVSPGRITVEFPTAGAVTGGWDLVVSTEAGVDSLPGALVLYDDPLPLARSVSSATTGAEIALSGVLTPFDSLAFSSGFNFYVKHVDALDTGSNARLVLSDDWPFASPSWSPSGDRFALASDGTSIGFITRATGVPTGVFFSGLGPAWSPVADRIAYTWFSGDETAVFTVDTSGQNETQVSFYADPGVANPAWTPDGKRISFLRYADNAIVDVSATLGEAAGTRTLAVLTNPGRHSWSPDGRWIAYSDMRSGNTDVYVRGSRETQYGEYRITTSAAVDQNPVWTRDGNRIAFVSDRSGTSNVYVAADFPFRDDADGDYVLDSADACPAGLPPLGKVDRNFNGCVDANSCFRNTRFWSVDRTPYHYEIHPTGDPRINDNSDITALTNAVAAWNTAVGFSAVRDTPPDIPDNAVAGDGRNTMTFVDPDRIRGGYLAITVITSVVDRDTMIDGTWFRPGEIVDADILFNAAKYAFITPSYPGLGQANLYDLQSLATHEVGHVLGLAHSSIASATMYWAIPKNDASFRTLAADDVALARRAYGSPAVNATGTIFRADGATPIPGAAVLAIAASSGDTLQMTTTHTDGTYAILGVTQSFRIYVLPIDGGPEVRGLVPAAVGSGFAAIAATDFMREYWDGPAETSSDGGPGLVVAVPGPPVTNANVIIDADVTGPSVVAFTPPNGATDIPVTTVVAAKFDDRIDMTSIASAVSLLRDGTTPVGGAAGLLQRDSLVVFTSTSALLYSTSYTFTIGPGIRDRAGNSMAGTASTTFTTQAQPALQLTAVAPVEVPVSSPVVLEGVGFSSIASQNQIQFTGVAPSVPSTATPTRLYATVPGNAQTGNVTVTTNSVTSNAVPITIVASREPPAVSALGNVVIVGTLKALAVSPGAAWAYVASTAGVTAVDADPQAAGFLETTFLPMFGGTTAVVTLGDGRHAVAVGPAQPRFRIIETDLVNRTHQVVAAAQLVDPPLGLAALPTGDVLVVHADRVVQLSTAVGVNAGQEVRAWSNATITFHGNLALSADGTRAFAQTTDGRIAVLGLQPGQQILAVGLSMGSTAPRELATSPAGNRFYTVDERGVMRIGDNNANTVKEADLDGGFRAVAISPEGELAFVADFVQNEVEIVNIQSNNMTPMSRFATARDPVDIATGDAGRYVYVIASGKLWVFDTQEGPRVTSVSPQSGSPGTHITLAGTGFDPNPVLNTVTIGGVAHLPILGHPLGTRLVVVQDTIPSGIAPQFNISVGVQVTAGGVPSNEVSYRVTAPSVAAAVPPFTIGNNLGAAIGRVLVEPPAGEHLIARVNTTLFRLDSDAAGNLQHWVQAVAGSGQTGITSTDGAMVMTPDGAKLFVVDAPASRIRILFWVTPTALVPMGNLRVAVGNEVIPSPSDIVLSPNGQYVYVRVGMGSQIWVFDVATNLRIAAWGLSSTAAAGLAIHPDGGRLYVSDFVGLGFGLRVFSADPFGGSFGALLGLISFPSGHTPLQLVADPDGSRVIALGTGPGTAVSPWLTVVDTGTGSPTYHQVRQQLQVDNGASGAGTIAMNRSGTALYVAYPLSGLRLRSYGASGPLLSGFSEQSLPSSPTPVDLAVSHDDGRLYYGGQTLVTLAPVTQLVGLVRASEFASVAVAGSFVPSPFAVRTVPGTLVRFLGPFRETLPSGAQTGVSIGYDIADANGFARSPTYSPSSAGLQLITCLATAGGVQFQVTVLADTTGPPQVVAVYPGSTDSPGVQTTIAVDFSKSIQAATVHVGSLNLRDGDLVLAANYAFLNRDRRVILSPQAPLDPARTYTLHYEAGLLDHAGTALSNPGTKTFTTSATPPQLELRAIAPPAARVGDPVVLSGSGFPGDATVVQVRFGDIAAQVVRGNAVALLVTVPLGAETGPVRVVLPTDSTDTVDFTVLPRGDDPRNDVIASIAAPASGHYIAIVPDGSRSYMTCPGGRTVVPMVIATRTAEDPITVGVHPFGIASAPDGRWIYVTNFLSDEVMVIGAAPGEPDFQQIAGLVLVYGSPTGIAVHPDGRRAYVANYFTQQVTILDIDATSTRYLTRLDVVDIGSRTQTVAITPDGERLVVGTADGILTMDPENPHDGTARAPVSTGTSAQTVVVTPDGGYAIVLGANGDIILIDLTINAEIARAPVSTGTSAQTVVVSGDGGSVYVSDSEGALLAVFRITEIQSGGPGGAAPRQWQLTGFEALPSIPVGENPVGMAFDPVSSQLLVVNAGDPSVGIIDATMTDATEVRPARASFSHPRPNPFRGQTTFMFDLPAPQHVEIRVYSVDGRLVRSVAAKPFPAGRHVVTWDGRTADGQRAAAGVYFVEARAGSWREHRKAVLLR